MKKTNNSRKGLARVTWALVLTLVWAICLTCVSMAAEAQDAFTQTLEVTQSVEGNATRTTYTYVLTPKSEENPMPENGPGTYNKEKNTYTFTLNGNDTYKTTLVFPADKAVDYQYELTRVETVPAGDTVKPESHLFGYLVEKDADGNWAIIPYTCYDGHMEIWKATDADGNPLGITLSNMIVGEKTTTTTTTTTTKKQSTTSKSSTTRSTTTTNVVTRTVNKIVNTGDPYQVGLWLGLIAASAGGLIAIAIVRRKKEKDNDNR